MVTFYAQSTSCCTSWRRLPYEWSRETHDIHRLLPYKHMIEVLPPLTEAQLSLYDRWDSHWLHCIQYQHTLYDDSIRMIENKIFSWTLRYLASSFFSSFETAMTPSPDVTTGVIPFSSPIPAVVIASPLVPMILSFLLNGFAREEVAGSFPRNDSCERLL